jgi:hypothetical protein
VTVFVSIGWVGIGAECIWPAVTVRLLLVSFGVVFGDMVQGWQRALARRVLR